MKVMKAILLLAIVGIALCSVDTSVEESFSFGSAFKSVGRGFSSGFSHVTSGVNTAVKQTSNVAQTAIKQTTSGVNTAVSQTQKGINVAVDQTKNGINIALDQTKKAVVNQAINNGMMVGVKWTQEEVTTAIDVSKKAFVNIGKMTVEQSNKYANEVKKMGLKIGNTLDPRQIKPEHLMKVLEGVRVVTGPLQVVLTNPVVAAALSRCGPKVQIAYKLLVLSVKCINDPEHALDHLKEANPIAGLLTKFVVATIKDPDHWQDHLLESAPAMGEAMLEIAKEQAAKKLKMHEKVSPYRRLMKHFSH